MNIDEVPAGRDLDALVAKALGWQVITCEEAIALSNKAFLDRPSWDDWYIQDMYIKEGPIPSTGFRGLPHFSIDIAAAWEVIETIVDKYNCICSVRKIAQRYQFGLVKQYAATIAGGDLAYDTPDCISATLANTAPLAICRAALKAVSNKNRL